MICNLQHHGAQAQSKENWTFDLMVEYAGLALASRGWRWYPETDTIRPPAFRAAGGFWVPAFSGVDRLVMDRIREDVGKVLGVVVDVDRKWDETPARDRPSMFSVGDVIHGRRLRGWVGTTPDWEEGNG